MPTDNARAAFRGRFTSKSDYDAYMRGLAARPRGPRRSRLVAEAEAERRGISLSTLRRYRVIEAHPDLVDQIVAGTLSRAKALAEARTRALPYAEQVRLREGTPTVEEAVRVFRALATRSALDPADIVTALKKSGTDLDEDAASLAILILLQGGSLLDHAAEQRKETPLGTS